MHWKVDDQITQCQAHEANGEENGDASGSLDNNDHIAEEGEARKADRNGSAKKKRHAPLWTPELHQLFEKTVLMLGNEGLITFPWVFNESIGFPYLFNLIGNWTENMNKGSENLTHLKQNQQW